MPSPTFAPGHDLVGRYRILELLGVGHTAEVYTADDLSLRRTVVVKVLLAQLASYEDVRRAFRDRIVRSATLSHPHVERVYDGGQESGHIFTITEYLPGGSLEDVLAAGRRLDVDDAARLGRDVAGALAYLHQSGFVHGALSPNSILFDGEGHVRVCDVALSGLAGMHGEPLTYDEVRYSSPEQALGEPASDKSDVYTLALIIFEAATGESPFEASTPEAMLRARVSTPLPVRAELGTLDMLLAQAAVPDARLRLDAEQFANRLGGSAINTAPLSLSTTGDERPLLAQFTPREPRTSIGFRPPSPDQIVGSTPGSSVQPFPRSPAARGTRPNRFAVSPGSLDADFEDRRRGRRSGYDDFASRRPPRGRRVALVGAAILIIVLAAGGAAAWKLGLFGMSHTVPSLVGSTPKVASQVLKEANDDFTFTITKRAHSSTVPSGEFSAQSPAAGTSGKSGLSIDVTMSEGPVLANLPANLVGESCATATSQLDQRHVRSECPTSAAIQSPTVPVGDIARVLYKATSASKAVVNPTSVPRGALVILQQSTGPATTTTIATTTTTVAGATTTTTVATIPAGATVAMPDVVGDDRAQAFAAMTKADLYFTTHGPGAGTDVWSKVVSQYPPAGTKVKKLSTVSLNVTE